MKNNPIIYCCLLAVFAIGYSVWADRAIYVVPTNAGASTPFTNWATAATNLIDAANVATNGNGDTVYVTNGVYQLTNQVAVKQGVKFRSIHDGEVDPNGTVVIGSGAQRCFYLYANALLAGFTITSGRVTGAAAGDTGGGIYTEPGTTISNCIITGNTVSNASIGSGGGIGMSYMSADSRTVTVSRCIIQGNLAWSDVNNNRGGGGAQFWSACVIQDSTVSLNWANSYGGGLHLVSNSVVNRCVISANRVLSAEGGGIYYISSGVNNVLTNSTVACNTNSGGTRAGGIYIHGAATISDCVITGNVASIGGGISILGNGVVRNSTIIGNRGGNYAGGLEMRAGTLANCQLIGNTAVSTVGGGAKIETSLATIRNCLVLNNVAATLGGGLNISDAGYANVSACSIVSNYAATGGGIYYNRSTAPATIFRDCIIYGNLSGFWNDYNAALASGSYTNDFYYSCSDSPLNLPLAQGCIIANPKFVSSAAANYRLQPNSPSRNTGSNETWMTGAVDLDGYRRIDFFSGRTDMGAYEYLPKGSVMGLR